MNTDIVYTSSLNAGSVYEALKIAAKMGWQPEMDDNGNLLVTYPDEDEGLFIFIFGEFC
jgi:hypothetical protein